MSQEGTITFPGGQGTADGRGGGGDGGVGVGGEGERGGVDGGGGPFGFDVLENDSGGLVAILEIAAQEFVEDLAEGLTDGVLEFLSPDPGFVLGVEEVFGRGVGEELDAGDAEAVEVAGKKRTTDGLLWSHVSGGADFGGGFLLAGGGGEFGGTEAEQDRLVVGLAADDVLGFDVAVDDLVGVDEVEDGEEVSQELPDLFFVEGACSLEFLGEGFAVNEFLD